MAVRRIVVTGASGNVGSGVLRALADAGDEVVGICRRPPVATGDVTWVALDLGAPDARDRLTEAFRGADAVVHLAWAIQPVRDEAYLHRVNVGGTAALLAAVTAAGVEQLVHASSLGVYAPGAAAPVTEQWPDSGQATSVYSQHKTTVERLLDRFELRHPDVAVSRIRPTLVVQRHAAAEIRGLFLGPYVPRAGLDLLRRTGLPVLPVPAGLELQFVHADDVGDAVARILDRRATGAFNLAADVLDADGIAAVLGARPVPVPTGAVRALAGALFAARVIPLSPGWFDVGITTPVMDTSRAREVLGWVPRHTTTAGARELLDGLADGATGPTPALGAAA